MVFDTMAGSRAISNRLAIALDLGTSGYRAQALDIANSEVLATAITIRHPLPGANVIDHLHFALEQSVESARDLIQQAVNQLIQRLKIPLDRVVRVAVCGNPTQLSLFQGMEIRDLAFAGSRKLRTLGLSRMERNAAIRSASDFPTLALADECGIIIPPAVHDEVGADTLALIIQSGLLKGNETAIAIDYGTNAEMALRHEGRIYTGSAAAGPALEGQHITCGALAMPGVIADIEQYPPTHRLLVLNEEMLAVRGARVDLRLATKAIEATGPEAKAITGTGVIAALDQGLEAGIITPPHIHTEDRNLHFGHDIYLTEKDLIEAGKAIGAIRAGYITLAIEAGINPLQIRSAYLAGASGTYVDAHKSERVGLIPAGVERIRQIGNTSLVMARELALAPSKLEEMSDLAHQLRGTYIMFANSETFARLFLIELSHWTEGMPMTMYREMLHRFHLPDLPATKSNPTIVQRLQRDISEMGYYGLTTLEAIGRVVSLQLDGCLNCLSCREACPAQALALDPTTRPATITLTYALCDGVACRRCELVCQPKVFHLGDFFTARPSTAGKEP
jgi:methylamine methyltransferase corrinoid protein reductive activase